MATITDLESNDFRSCVVTCRTMNIVHPAHPHAGPFCRLDVEDNAPESPGVYAWTQNDVVMYVGRAGVLRQIVNGVRMARAYNDYTYVPSSKVAQMSSPRVRVNALLNQALADGCQVAWWWRTSEDVPDSIALEARLIGHWRPAWNRAMPLGGRRELLVE